MATRNPSPPPDAGGASKSEDKIGESAYSKRWLYSLTLRVLSVLQSEVPTGDNDTGVDELDSDLEDELCCLWDITANKDILAHLRDFNLIPVFSSAIVYVRCPRLMEIALGILANLALDEVQCVLMTEDAAVIPNALGLLASTDTRILIELFRLIRVVLASHSHRQLWLEAIHFTPEFFDCINFILCSSTNANLLMSTISATETIIRIDDSICELWCNEKLLTSILEAQKQMHWMHGDEVEIIHRLLYIFSSNSAGVYTLMARFHDLYPGFGIYLRKVCEDEPHLIPFAQYHNSLRALIPVIDVIVTNLPLIQALITFDSDPGILPCLLKITWGCYQQTSHINSLLLSGLWEDLSVMLGDLVMRAHDLVKEKMPADSDAMTTPPTSVSRMLRWLYDLEEATTANGLREAFVHCCLSGRTEVRGCLVYVCHQLRLATLLDCVTDDN